MTNCGSFRLMIEEEKSTGSLLEGEKDVVLAAESESFFR